VAGPVSTIAAALIYYDQRVRKEAFEPAIDDGSIGQPQPLRRFRCQPPRLRLSWMKYHTAKSFRPHRRFRTGDPGYAFFCFAGKGNQPVGCRVSPTTSRPRGKSESLEAHPEQAGEVDSAIPDHVTVSTAAGETTVSYHDLKNDLTVFSKAEPEKRSVLLRQIKNYVQALSSEAEAYDKSRSDPALARTS